MNIDCYFKYITDDIIYLKNNNKIEQFTVIDYNLHPSENEHKFEQKPELGFLMFLMFTIKLN